MSLLDHMYKEHNIVPSLHVSNGLLLFITVFFNFVFFFQHTGNRQESENWTKKIGAVRTGDFACWNTNDCMGKGKGKGRSELSRFDRVVHLVRHFETRHHTVPIISCSGNRVYLSCCL